MLKSNFILSKTRNTIKAIFLFSLMILLLSFGGCARSLKDVIKKELNFGGTIVEVRANSILVSVDPTEDAYESSDLISVSLDTEIENNFTFETDQHVRVYYSGEIMESYPAQLSHVYAIVMETAATADTNETSVNFSITEHTSADNLSASALFDAANQPTGSSPSSIDAGIWAFDGENAFVYTLSKPDTTDEEDILFLPTVAIDPVNKTFTFTTSLFSSYLHAGHYEIISGADLPEAALSTAAADNSAGISADSAAAAVSDRILKLRDDSFTYYFTIIGNGELTDCDALIFLQTISDATDFYDERIDVPVEDGALFVPSGK